MNLIVKLSVFFAMLAGLAYIFVTPDPAKQLALTPHTKAERNMAQQQKLKADKQKVLKKIIRYKKQADKWLDLTNNPKAYTGGGTVEYSKQVKLVAEYRPKIEKIRAKLYQLQRCFETSFSRSAMKLCKADFTKLNPFHLRSLSKITLDEKQT